MTIITANNNPKNDSAWARHRSLWKGQTNVLDGVIAGLKRQQRVKYKRYIGTPKQVRDMWCADFKENLPVFRAHAFIEPSGVYAWLTTPSPFADDVKLIWEDFVRIFGKRSDPAGTTKELLFMSNTKQYFDLIYSKWGVAPGKHWFFHWTSMVAPQPVNRATIDVGNDDEDGEGVEND